MEQLIKDCLSDIPLNLKLHTSPIYDRQGKICGGFYLVTNAENGERVSTFVLQPMLGCNGIVVSRKVAILGNYKGCGYGSTLCKLREQISAYLGYSLMFCTCVLGNIPQQKILAKNGWEIGHEFLNKKTNNRVRTYFKKL